MRYKRSNNSVKLAVAVGLILAWLFLVSFDRGREFFAKITTPLFAISANAQDAFLSLARETKTKNELFTEIEELKRERAELLFENMTHQILRKENQELKESLGWNPEEEFALARVVARPPVIPFDSLTIETGRIRYEDGERVRIAKSVEVGRITTVHERTAIVSLYTSTGMRTPVEINGGGPLVIAEGMGGGSFTLRVPRSFEVQTGDLLTRPGMKSVIIGTVESVEKSETDSFSLVRARSPINIFEITWVYVENSSKR